MRTPLLLLTGFTIASAGPLAAQTPPAALPELSAPAAPALSSPPAAAPAAPKSPLSALGTANLESNTLLKIIDKAFDTDSDAFNPEDGTLTWKGHTYNLGQMRVFRARFERYLAQPESIDNEVYRGVLDEIFTLLSTRGGEAGAENVRKAWQLLYRACDYEADAGASLAIANQVFNAWRIRDERDALAVTQSELDRIRRQQQAELIYGADTLAREASQKAMETGEKAASSTEDQNKSQTPLQQTGMSQTFRARELAETEAKIKASETGAALTGLQAKLQFQTALVNLFLQRRFQHCLIAASFYRFIFKGSAQEMEVGKKEIQSFLPSSDLSLTVDTLEFLAREAINDTESAMKAVNASYADGQLVGALERLQETFFLGEYLPAVSQFERDKKQALLTLYRQIDQARKLADLKDYDAVDKLVAEVGMNAKDFRSSEVLSAIHSARRMSSLAIHSARQAVVVEDFERAQESIQRAAELWPLNPDLQTYTQSLAEKIDLGARAAEVFDDALKRGDWRRIYDQRVQLGMALLTDAARAGQMEKIVEQVSRVEIYLTQARELVAQNNAFAAWEALETASQLVPNDVALNQRRAELAPRVAIFVGKIDAARRHEEAAQPAAALTQWLAAQTLYPASSLARLGIDRVSGRILDELALETAAKPGAN